MKLSLLSPLMALALAGCTPAMTASVGMPASTSWSASPKNSLLGDASSKVGGATTESGETTALFLAPFGPVFWQGSSLRVPTGSMLGSFAPAPSERHGAAIALTSESHGWAVGNGVARLEGGHWVAETTEVDASMSTVVPLSQRIQLTDVAFASGSTTVGYAVGTLGTVLKYNATQQRWDKVTLPSTLAGKNFGTVKLVSESDIWVAGEAVAHCVNGTWSEVALPTGVTSISGLGVISATNLWASAGDRLIQWNGTAWSAPVVPHAGHEIGAPQFVTSGGTVLGAAVEPGVPGGDLYVYQNGQWQVGLILPDDVGLDSLAVVNAQTIYAKSYDNTGVWKYDGQRITRFAD